MTTSGVTQSYKLAYGPQLPFVDACDEFWDQAAHADIGEAETEDGGFAEIR